LLFDVNAHTVVSTYVPNEKLCGLNYYDVDKASFSADGQHLFVKMDCGIDNEKTVLFFYRIN